MIFQVDETLSLFSPTGNIADLTGDSLLAAGTSKPSVITTTTTTSCSQQPQQCPTSPTETESSSGFSTLRKRSVNVTEKVRQNRDGSKIQEC